MAKRKRTDDGKREAFIFSLGQARFYLAPYKGCANNEEWLRERNIRYIVNVSNLVNVFERTTLEELGRILYCKVPVEDRSDAKQADRLIEHIPRAIRFLREKSELSCGILVHCMEGRCRSPAIMIAFMIACGRWDLASAYALLKEKVPNLLINTAFMNILREYEVVTKDLTETTLPMEERSTKKRSLYFRTTDYQTT